MVAQDPPRYSIVVHEIFADPTPPRGLPGSEFLELRNRSSSDINLRNWTIRVGSSTGRISSSFILRPDSVVVITTSGAASAYQNFGAAIAISPFPTLDNDGDTITILAPMGSVIHAIAWNKRWYKNDIKEDGGWSLEMKDIANPCVEEENWLASISPVGGTPGKPNSIRTIVKDSTAPYARFAYMTDSQTIHLLINEPLDKVPAITIKDLTFTSSELLPPLFNTVIIKLKEPVAMDLISDVTIENIRDCSGNTGLKDSIAFGRFSPVIKNKMVINEVLFDPPVGGWDYIEIFNRSSELINLRDLFLGNRNSLGKISSLSRLSSIPFPIFPSEYVVICGDTTWLKKYYDPGAVKMIQVSLPSYPDDAGNVVLADDAGNVIDELEYSAKWHHALVSEPRGVALERLMPGRPTQDKQNWHSASGSSRYGTPGYRNSQYTDSNASNRKVLQLSSRIVSPDMDGRDDVLVMNYALDQAGYFVNLSVFDQQGRLVRRIAENQLCGVTGYFRWDGLDNGQQKLPRGNYIIYAEFFSLTGKLIREKHSIGVW